MKLPACGKSRFPDRGSGIPSGLSAVPLNAVRIPGGKKLRKNPGFFPENKKGIPLGN